MTPVATYADADARRAAAAARARAEAESTPQRREPWRTAHGVVLPWLRNRFDRPQLRNAQINVDALRATRRLAIVVASRELPTTEPFFAHHRELGVQHFLCLLLGDAPASEAPDISCVRLSKAAPASILKAVNHLAYRWGLNRWVLFLLPHEFLVYPRMETRSLADLVQHLDDDRRHTMHAAIIDLYGQQPVADLAERRATERFFDPTGYFQFAASHNRVEIRGGPLARIADAAAPHRAPMLQRIVLARWAPHYRFVRFRQLARPLKLNRAHKPGEVSITGALLRHGALTPDGRAAPALGDALGFEDEIGCVTRPAKAPVWFDPSQAVRFTESADLVAAGLMGPGRWF
jgi:hypothetical protein